MKVKVIFDFDIVERKAVGRLTGDQIASHDQMRRWAQSQVDMTLEVVVAEYEEDHPR